MTPTLKTERLPKSRVVTTLVFAKEDVTAAEDQALQVLGSRTEIKGFRVGHAPSDQIRARVKPEDLLEETVRILVRGQLPTIVEQEKIHPVIPPKIEVVSREPLTLTVTFVEKPTVTLKSEKLKVTKKDIAIKEEDVEKVLQSVLGEHRTAHAVDRAAKQGDQVTIDFSAKDEAGKDIGGLTATGYSVLIGAAHLLPGFEEQLVGLKKGDQKTFTLNLPEKFQVEELRGKPAAFTVTVTNVEETHLPALTDEFAKEKLNAASADAFKTMIRDSIKGQEEQFQQMQREKELFELIRTHTNVEIAEELLEEEMRSLVSEWSEQLERQQMTIADALKKEGRTIEQAEKDLKKQAEDRWKLRLGMAKLIEEKGITISDDELNAARDEFLARLPADQKDAARKEFDSRGQLFEELRWRAMVEKAVTSLLA
jgi:trigger factor